MNYNPTEIVTTTDLSAMFKMIIPSIKNTIIMLLQRHGVSINLSPILNTPLADSLRWDCLQVPIDGEMRLCEIRTDGDELIIKIECMKDEYHLHYLDYYDWYRILLVVETVFLRKNSKELRELGVIVKN